MQTKVVKPIEKELVKAALLIKKGEIVAFPTETVYGLGANAFDEKAVKKIFAAKGRPADNPLIVHISSIKQLNGLVDFVPKEVQILADAFWPGPLTMVMKKSQKVPAIVTAGLDSVAIRLPSNKIALNLIKKSAVPIAAPSANSSGRPSPTEAIHVKNDLNGKIKLIIDGGKCQIGLESTVLDITKKPFTILRPGKVTKEEIEGVLHEKIKINIKKNPEKASSPGMKYKHYSPKAKVILFSKKDFEKKVSELKEEDIAVIFFNNDIESYAKEMFSLFRKYDAERYDVILVEKVAEKGLGLALMNRLKKASSKK